MAQIPENPSLTQLQQYQLEICKERGWDKASELQCFLLFTEEIGELAKAIRYNKEIFTESGKKLKENALEEEFADVLGYLLELANHFQVDLENAFRKKEAKNALRVWNT